MNARTPGVLVMLLLLAGCAAPTASVTAGGNQAELRQMQTREYQQLDRRSAMRSVIATLQDLGFVVDITFQEQLGRRQRAPFSEQLTRHAPGAITPPPLHGRRESDQVRKDP